MRLHRIGSLVALAAACCHPPTPAMIPKGRIAAFTLPGHVLFRVPPGRVEDAARAWEEAGFVVVRGGPSEDLVNAMIYFPDGWFIELFGLGPQLRVTLPLFFARFIDPAMHTRFGSLVRATGEEWLDWSVDVTNLARVRDNLDSSGVSISSVRSFARTQSDGSEVAWELAMPEDASPAFPKEPLSRAPPYPRCREASSQRCQGNRSGGPRGSRCGSRETSTHVAGRTNNTREPGHSSRRRSRRA